MLIWLLDHLTALSPDARWAIKVAACAKLTFRTALAALLSFALGVVFGPWVISWLQVRFREPLSDRSPVLRDLNRHKAATPTMGGLFLVGGIVIASALLCNWQNVYVPIVLFNLVALAVVGAIDDLRKLS
ncbi:MAG TPA: hypothetical protein VGI75_11625, partial [Pirellulales bacterium]